MHDPVADEQPPVAFTAAHRGALAERRADQDRTLESLHELEAALAAGAPGREARWQRDVGDAIEVLDAATAEEERNANQPASLLSDIARTQPRLRNRVRGVRVQYAQLRQRIAALRSEVAVTDDADLDPLDLRQRVGDVIRALHLLRGRESDLIYEAYYDAFDRDVEEELRGDRS
jgi:hypothetical protein